MLCLLTSLSGPFPDEDELTRHPYPWHVFRQGSHMTLHSRRGNHSTFLIPGLVSGFKLCDLLAVEIETIRVSNNSDAMLLAISAPKFRGTTA
jgi:hypothetical protein